MSTSDAPTTPLDGSNDATGNLKPKFERLYLKSHRNLITFQAEIFQRVKDNPEEARLLVLNPVLAFAELGIQASPKMRRHILETIQHPTQVRQRRTELEEKLKEALGEMPSPNDPEWVSRFLFKTLKIKPLNIKGLRPTYRPLINEAGLQRLNNLRPPSRKRYHYEASISAGSAVEVRQWQPSARNMDLEAPLPELKRTRKAPAEITLEELYFYKDSHPLARDLLELGMIQRSSFNFHSRSNIRKIKEGKVANALYRWVKYVRFPEEHPNEPDV